MFQWEMWFSGGGVRAHFQDTCSRPVQNLRAGRLRRTGTQKLRVSRRSTDFEVSMVQIDLLAPDAPAATRAPHPLWACGFRPFFLVAAIFAVVAVPWWATIFARGLSVATGWSALSWHGHEMIFGFALAVIAGFLLTAVQNWTKGVTAQGPWLMALVALWVAGRVAMSGVWEPGILGAILDLSFVPALAVAIGRPLRATKNRRNYAFVAMLGALFVMNLLMHLASLGAPVGGERLWLLASLDLVVVMMLVVGGRVIPMFTSNATGVAVRKPTWLEKALVTFVGLSIASQIALGLGAQSLRWVAIASSALAGVAVIARMVGWGTRATLKVPLLWVLHAGHAWIGVGFLLRAAAYLWPQVSSAMATHAITVGAVGMLTLGMMARVALGHTGRPLKAHASLGWAFALLGVAALGRTFLPMIAPALLAGAWPGYYVGFVSFSAALWAVAFLIYAVVYLPVLTRPRVDGRPG
ncbi:NnrS family protein [Lujinxingia vulgaris]|uniref:NnrS family protein n=2 Tax=Lujinxingia vulgaris TaxID=2600176 RepID=A0A5C6X6N0_9DELT|nr:NnrS family protein [Lujinxingia vulgaris]